MALQKSNLAINFSQGLDLQTDPLQVAPGKMLALANTVLTKGGKYEKRNGFLQLANLPNSDATFLTTFKSDLTAIDGSIQAYSSGSNMWVTRGSIKPLQLDTLSLIRSNTNQSQADTAMSSNGQVCTVFTDNVTSGSTTAASYKFVVADSATGQNVIAPTVITPTSGTVTGSPRVFTLGKYFVVVFPVIITATNHIQYIAINSHTLVINAAVDITSQYDPNSPEVAFDGVVANNSLYLAWNGSDIGGAIRIASINSALTQSSAVVFATKVATQIAVAADTTQSTPNIYVTIYDSVSNDGYILAVNQQLSTVLAPTLITSGSIILNITLAAQNQVATAFFEFQNAYSWDATLASNFIKSRTCTQAGALGTMTTIARSVGLASKACIVDGDIYFLCAYDSDFQPTYFLSDVTGKIVAKLAYSNGGGYVTSGLPSVTVDGSSLSVAYLIKDLIAGVNKLQGATSAAGVYSQTGINLASFTISTNNLATAEIGNNLHLSGGFLWMYDGYLPVEHGFHLWPDDVNGSKAGTGGGLLAQQYYYQVTYEWSDNQGNVHRSAPSIPLLVDSTNTSTTPVTFRSIFSTGASSITVSSATGLFVGQVLTDSTTGANIQAGTYITSISGTTVGLSLPTAGNSAASPGDLLSTNNSVANTLKIPTLRLTYKTSNPVKIVIYRWSTAQQTYYQVTSTQIPTLNSTTTDSITYVDTLNDRAIIGNNIIYTTGGVVENIAPPAVAAIALFKGRLFTLNAEDKNSIGFSKQVIQNTPVEMSDLFTIFVSPTISAQGSTGVARVLAPLDDKLIFFKKSAIYYITGNGPDNTGANNDFSEPVFITSTVGSENQNSIVFIPQGIMFQSDKGIWLLGRDLSTKYIGAPVQDYNDFQVLSAISVPGKNQVRFTLDNGVTLMYDYFWDQWGTFTNIPAISSTLYQDKHTYINEFGQTFQENPGSYLDGSTPVLMSFTTGWLNLAGLQGFERGYYFYLLGTYISPHKLSIKIAYDYNPSPSQVTVITPDNYSAVYGSDSLYGGGPAYGGSPTLEQWRVFMQQQKCQAFQITVEESFDPQYGTTPGAGLSFSGLNLVVGIKGSYPRLKPSRSVG